ncbi:MAG: glycosyl transferase family 1 [Chloroflexi bacterium]|nr:MAG: glycosyl transferase family 1 [Chloroflexota bacterium]
MKILHVTPAFYPATYWGGPIYSVYGLCNALAKLPNVALRVLTTDAAGSHRSDRIDVTGFPMLYQGGYEVFCCPRRWGADLSLRMLLQLWPMIRWADVVHLTGVYSPPTIPTLLLCRLAGKPLAWSPRGSLQRWERSTKPLAKKIWEKVCTALIRNRRCLLHVTSEEEARDSEARIPNAQAVVIPNGVDVPELPTRDWQPRGQLRLLYLGRLHPIKGIENLLKAIQVLTDRSITLALCGDGEEQYLRILTTLVKELGIEASVKFRGHVDGSEKLKGFTEADICVLPSFSENFGIAVAEALAHGIPVIASKGTPWSGLEKHGCGMWVDNAPQSLAMAISSLRTKSLEQMGERGRAWMKQEFDWITVATKIFALYSALVDHQGLHKITRVV